MRGTLPSSALSHNYYSTIHRANQLPQIATSLRKTIDTTTVSYSADSSSYTKDLDIYTKEFLLSKLLSHLYTHFLPKLISKYLHHDLKSSHSKDLSFFKMMNPFICGTDESSAEDNDYNDFIDTSDFFKRRKYKKIFKKKKKKKLKAKKFIFVKLLVMFVIFIALKALFEKIYYFFPTIFPTTARDEYLEDVDPIYQNGFHTEKASDWNKAQQLGDKYQAVFAPEFQETRIDFTIPVRRKVVTDF